MNHNYFNYIFLFLLVYSTKSIALEIGGQKVTIHDIDEWVETQLDNKSLTTNDIRNIYLEAYNRWDQELNREYQELKSKLDKDQYMLLLETQRQWLKYRDSEFKVSAVLNTIEKGTMGYLVHDARKVAIVRERVLALKAYRTFQ